MLEIKFTLDATPELIGALRDIAGAIHGVYHPVPTLASDGMNGNVREEKYEVSGKDQDLPYEASVEAERTEATEDVEVPKKRKPRAKKAHSESNTPVAPAIGDNLSPAGEAVPESASAIETPAEPETAPVAEDTAPAEEAPSDLAEDPLAGKGQTGEILAELTRKAIGDLDALGVDRGDANRRIRDYCARNEIKFPTFPALLQAVGYAEAIAICKGA